MVDAIKTTVADTQEDLTDMAADEAMTRRALELLGSRRNERLAGDPLPTRPEIV